MNYVGKGLSELISLSNIAEVSLAKSQSVYHLIYSLLINLSFDIDI